MLKDFIREVVVIVVGKQAEPIADLLNSKKYVNEFILAKKLEITINQTRNILYKLADRGLVSHIRKKDKKKGWYTYFWMIEGLKVLEFLKDILEKKIEQIDNQIKSRETKQFYQCKTCNIEFTEENALLYDFTCNECGQIFTMKDNTKVLREMSKNKNKFVKRLETVEEEIAKEEEKITQQIEKENKKVAKEKADKRKVTREKNALDRKALKKELDKKKVSKKPLRGRSSTQSLRDARRTQSLRIKKKLKKKIVKKKKATKNIPQKRTIKKVSKKTSSKKTKRVSAKKSIKKNKK